jgi:hypothetical protein
VGGDFGCVGVGPALDLVEQGGEGDAEGGQAIFDTQGCPCDDMPGKEAVALEGADEVCEYFLGDSAEGTA